MFLPFKVYMSGCFKKMIFIINLSNRLISEFVLLDILRICLFLSLISKLAIGSSKKLLLEHWTKVNGTLLWMRSPKSISIVEFFGMDL